MKTEYKDPSEFDKFLPLMKGYDVLFNRYYTKANNLDVSDQSDRERLKDMCSYCIYNTEMDITKSSRWLGFIQGVLYAKGVIDIQDERDFSRTIIHKAFKEMGLTQPNTISIEGKK